MMQHVNIFTLPLMTDILEKINFFLLVLQKQERKFIDIKITMENTVKTLESLLSAISSEQFENVISLSNTQNKRSYYVSCQQYVNIVENYSESHKNLRSHWSNIDIKSYHEKTAKPLLKKLIAEINEAFQTNNFSVLDTLHIFDTRCIPKSIDEAAAKDVSIVYDWYAINKIDMYDYLWKQSAALKSCARETFLNEFKSYSISIGIKKIGKIQYH